MRMALLLYMLTGCANRSYMYGRQVALGLYGYLYSASDHRWLPGYIDPAEHPTFRNLKGSIMDRGAKSGVVLHWVSANPAPYSGLPWYKTVIPVIRNCLAVVKYT